MKIVAISDAVTLGLHTMELLARQPEQRWSTRIIAEKLNASAHHLSKIHSRLVKAGLVRSTRGPRGGLILARDPSTISLMDVFTSIDGEFRPDHCLFGYPVCSRRTCVFGSLIRDVTRQVTEYFRNTTVADLVENTG
ncbi:MAG TPA: Rrf2 family transcriptional regulator [bacterium]|nr:Rrf2 family transcriptional regulator [bacterium]